MMSNFEDAPIKAEGQLVDPGAVGLERRKDSDLDAYADLMDALEEGEVVAGVVFGAYGWDGYHEEEFLAQPIPADKRGVVLTLNEARPLMHGWSFYGGYGAPTAYATYIWTNKRVIWVTQYDGSTTLDSAPRNPVDCVPGMPGG